MILRVSQILTGLMCLASSVFAVGQLQITQATVGERYIVLTLDDSIHSPDLSNIQVEGYSVENAIFVEEEESMPTIFTPEYYDITSPGKGRVFDFNSKLGLMIVDLPSSFIPKPGTVFSDTSFNGLLCKVISIESQSAKGLTQKRWILKTIPADLPEAVENCEISFKTRVDLTQSLADFTKERDLSSDVHDSISARGVGQLALSMKSSQILFQPTVTGRIRIQKSKVEIFNISVTGDCEVNGKFTGAYFGSSPVNFEQTLLGKTPYVLPLGGGLFVKIQNKPLLKVEVAAKTQSLSIQGGFRIHNFLKVGLNFLDGQWRPLAENKMTVSEKFLGSIQGTGEMKISITPKVEVLFEGIHGPQLTFEPFARFTSSLDSAASILGTENGAASKGMILGTNILMDMRANFLGPLDQRQFLLFNYEQKVLGPPREGTLSLREIDSSRIQFSPQTFPKANYYFLQQKLADGEWETLPEKMIHPKIKISSLKANSMYRFRAIGVNEFGNGAAFPLDGINFNTANINHPPFLPQLILPDSVLSLADTVQTLVWKGGDPDANTKVLYTIYLDTQNPPLNIRSHNLNDTSLLVQGLALGKTYYWKVVAFDGIERSESRILSFSVSVKIALKVELKSDIQLDIKLGSGNKNVVGAFAFIPKGSFKREDGKTIFIGPFLMGKTEVTQMEFQKKMHTNPSYRFYDSLPVERVTWEEAQNYCQEVGGRLPTESEWEFAARAGSSERFYWGKDKDGDYAWYRDNSNNRTQKVAHKKANAWGLYDMAGNVFEWVHDWHGDYSATKLDHPNGPETGTAKVIRGASWYSEAQNLNLSARYSNRPGFRNFKVGFRCAKDVQNVILGSAEPSSRP